MLIGFLSYWDGRKMPSPNEIGAFAFGIRLIRQPDGSVKYQTDSVNKNVPVEIVIMQMKIFLNDLEKEYSDRYSKKE